MCGGAARQAPCSCDAPGNGCPTPGLESAKELFMRRRRNSPGFTFVEMAVVVAIVAAMAAILVPILADELASSEQSHALSDCQRIAAALTQYTRDTRPFPTGPNGNDTLRFLTGTGTVPAANPFDDGEGGLLVQYLANGAANGGASWRGPYLQQVAADPWGNAYVVNVHGYFSAENVWVVSAGPNGAIYTTATDPTPRGDDIGVLVKLSDGGSLPYARMMKCASTT